jgi:hypothetical protein
MMMIAVGASARLAMATAQNKVWLNAGVVLGKIWRRLQKWQGAPNTQSFDGDGAGRPRAVLWTIVQICTGSPNGTYCVCVCTAGT